METRALVKVEAGELDQVLNLVDEAFNYWLYKIKDRSDKTIEHYLQCWGYFQKYIGAENREQAFAMLLGGGPAQANSLVGEWMNYLRKEKKLRPRTSNNYLSVISSLVDAVKDWGKINWTIGVKGAKIPETEEPEGPGIEAINKILSMLKEKNDMKSIRDYAIILMYKEEISRRGEIQNLDIEDINFNEMEIKVKTKGNPQKESKAISPTFREALENWLKIRKVKRGPVFIRINGLNKENPERLTGVSLWRMVREYGKAIGLEMNIHPHSFRHTMVSYLCDQGHHVKKIMAMTGHKDPKTLAIYFMNRKKDQREMVSVLSAA